MKRCQIDCDLLTEFDLFGKEPEFFYKGKAQRTSWFGRIFSVFYIVLYVAFVIYKLVRMIEKVDIDFYETYEGLFNSTFLSLLTILIICLVS